MFKNLIFMIALATAASSLASADILPFSWSTTGSFSSSGLTFTPVAAAAPINTDASGNLTGILLGAITFPDVTTDFSGTFNLTVNFIRPGGAQDPTYAAPFTLDANASGVNDTLLIDFPAPSLLTFAGTDGSGSFNFAIPDLTFTRTGSGQTKTVNLLGNISGAAITATSNVPTTAPVPEPSSWALMASVVVGLAYKIRRGCRS
jgi:hypothetical protein